MAATRHPHGSGMSPDDLDDPDDPNDLGVLTSDEQQHHDDSLRVDVWKCRKRHIRAQMREKYHDDQANVDPSPAHRTRALEVRVALSRTCAYVCVCVCARACACV